MAGGVGVRFWGQARGPDASRQTPLALLPTVLVAVLLCGVAAAPAGWLISPGLAAMAAPEPGAGLTPGPASESGPEPSISLRCQIDGRAWQPCRMVIESLGEHWWLQVGGRRFEFRHDGHGNVTVADGAGPPHAVTPRWRSSGVLCWDGLCAEGPIPLD